jgi:hypothetical protein
MREGRQPRVRPVFLDRSGRRRRIAVFLGAGLATALTAGLGLLVVALSGASSVDLPGFPDAGQHEVAPEPVITRTPPVTTTPPDRRQANPTGTTDGATTAAPTPTTTTPDHPGNGRNPTRTPPRPRPTKNK